MTPQQASNTYYLRGRTILRVLAFGLAILFIYGAFFVFQKMRQGPSVLILLVAYTLVAFDAAAFAFAQASIRVITSTSGIEYRRPEFTLHASWDQVIDVESSSLPYSIAAPRFLIVSDPTPTYSKWWGLAYRLSPGNFLFPGLKYMIPLGERVWQKNTQLERDIHSHVPHLPSMATAAA